MSTDREYQNALRDLLGGKNDVERGIILDQNCQVDRQPNGAWVQVWFWVGNEDMEENF